MAEQIVALLISHGFKFVFAGSALWTGPIFRDVLKRSSRRNFIVGIAHGWIIDISANKTSVFFHYFSSLVRIVSGFCAIQVLLFEIFYRISDRGQFEYLTTSSAGEKL